MRPLSVLTGIILGSCFAISIGLLVVTLLYFLNAQHDYIRQDIPALLGHGVIFLGLTVLAAAAFWGSIRERWWLWYSQALLWLALGLTVFHYWPD
ncbi:hypothetical protein [Natronospira bacteriovora]|uniref:Uncharacterized protein n=1 Tax=Natronospira bacteriovora TaxID=3069753 RepID=A0ABU0W301_9GAMM|nr:hypothetical protein [Natronospira sp. AB-CW4]MDQ2068392.1 hypothetical protein [Natronospira sp. AB-CW4]